MADNSSSSNNNNNSYHSSSRRKYVIPGDVVTTGPFRPEQNVVLDGTKIISTVVGISELYEDTVRVISLTGKYIPKINDLIIGKVISHTSLSWELDINSCYVGFLPAQDVFGRISLPMPTNLYPN